MLSISMTSEGVKKLSILGTLLGNRYLSKDSIIFIDEPESALHPQLVSVFMDMIMSLSKMGIQFFIASHSYFVIKKLYLLAHQQGGCRCLWCRSTRVAATSALICVRRCPAILSLMSR